MPDYPYDHTYAAGDECLSGKAWRPIVHRVNQRLQAIWRVPLATDEADVAGQPALTSIPAGGISGDAMELAADHPPGTVASWTWQTLIRVVDLMGEAGWLAPDGNDVRFVDPDAFDPDIPLPATPQEQPVLKDRAAWPGASGWTRKREREITALSDGGTDGQRARYLWTSGVSSPSELSLGTKFVDRVAGAWVLSADQTAPADILTSYGLPQPGDIFGPHVLNDVQTALDDLRWTLGPAYWRWAFQAADSVTLDATRGPLADERDQLAANWPGAYGPDEYSLATETDLTGYGYGGDGSIGTWQSQGDTMGGDEWWVTAGSTRLQPSAYDLPGHVSREVDFWVRSTASDEATNSTAGVPRVYEFDANGTPFDGSGVFQLVETVGPGTGTADGSVYGLAAGTLPAQPSTDDDNTIRGWRVEVGDLLALARWDVAGGFD